jgi:hypothetical protein
LGAALAAVVSPSSSSDNSPVGVKGPGDVECDGPTEM